MAASRLTLLLLAQTVTLASSCADFDAGRSQRAIVGGQPVDNASVVRILGAGLCGATVLAPRLLLTARHCVAHVRPGPRICDEEGNVVPPNPDDPVQYPDAGSFEPTLAPDQIVVGGGLWDEGYTPGVVDVLTTSDDTICRSDAALLVLDQGLDEFPPAPIRLQRTPSVGEELTVVGYGQTESDDQSTTLLGRDVSTLAVGPESAVPGEVDAVPPGFFTVGEGPCRGDSGSPALSGDGALVGLASALSRADLDEFDGTAADCTGKLARGKYQRVDAIRDLVLAAFDEAEAVPWREGEPDPRAGLSQIGEACQGDNDCNSHICVPLDAGGRVCSYGCLGAPCPSSYECRDVDQKLRCVPVAATEPEPDPGSADGAGGCAITAGHVPGAAALLLFYVVALSRRRRRR